VALPLLLPLLLCLHQQQPRAVPLLLLPLLLPLLLLLLLFLLHPLAGSAQGNNTGTAQHIMIAQHVAEWLELMQNSRSLLAAGNLLTCVCCIQPCTQEHALFVQLPPCCSALLCCSPFSLVLLLLWLRHCSLTSPQLAFSDTNSCALCFFTQHSCATPALPVSKGP
jgi:hypothetical protein